MFGRAGDVHSEVVLAGVAVLLIGAFGRLAFGGTVGVQFLDAAVVHDGGGVAPERIGRAVDLGGQRLPVLRQVCGGLGFGLTRVVGAEAVLGADKACPLLSQSGLRGADDQRRGNEGSEAHVCSSASTATRRPVWCRDTAENDWDAQAYNPRVITGSASRRVAGIACAGALIGAMSLAGHGQARSIADRVYSDTQATRGQPLYQKQCLSCHGATLEGVVGPPLTGDGFLSVWSSRSLADLVNKIEQT